MLPFNISKHEDDIFLYLKKDGERKAKVDWEFDRWESDKVHLQVFFDDPLSVSSSYPYDYLLLFLFDPKTFMSPIGDTLIDKFMFREIPP